MNNVIVVYTDGGRRAGKLDNFLGVGSGIYAYAYDNTDMENFSHRWPKVDAIFTPMGICCKEAVKEYSKDANNKLVEEFAAIMASTDVSRETKLAKWHDKVAAEARGKGKDKGFTPLEKMGKTAKLIIPYLGQYDAKELLKVANKTSVPIEITEMVIPLAQEETSNVAELQSFIEALRLAKDMSMAYIYSDSEYVVKGVTEYMVNWKARDWRKGDGELVKNLDYWVEIDKLMNSTECTILISHINSHRGNFGNEQVDDMATLATMMSANFNFDAMRIDYPLSEASKQIPEKLIPRQLALKWIYRYTNTEEQTTSIRDEKWFGYLTGDHVRKSSAPPQLVGKPQPDAMYGLVYQRECLPIIKEMADVVHDRVYRDSKNEMDQFDFFTLLNAGNLNRDCTGLAMKFGTSALKYSYSQHYLENLSGDPLVISMHKPMLSRRLFDINETMNMLLGSTMSKLGVKTELATGDAKGLDILDITEFFTDGKKIHQLNEAAIQLDVNGVVLRLAIGIDVPSRAILMDEAKHNLQVKLVTYNATKNSFMYFCYVESDNLYSIWYNPYSNRRLLFTEDE